MESGVDGHLGFVGMVYSERKDASGSIEPPSEKAAAAISTSRDLTHLCGATPTNQALRTAVRALGSIPLESTNRNISLTADTPPYKISL